MIAALLAVLSASASDAPSSIKLARVEARLFFKETGRLSDDLLNRPEPFVGFNTIIGEGEADEAADDLLVTVRLEADKFGDKSHKFVQSPVEISVHNKVGKLLGRRRWESILTSQKGIEVKPLWLTDVTCAGDLTVTARYNGTVRTETLQFICGE